MPRAFISGPGRVGFSMSPHHSRNSYSQQIQLIAAVKQRVGIAALWWNSSTSDINAIGPMSHPTGSPDAIDPVFIHGTLTATWDDGHTASVEFTYDIQYEDMTRVFTYSWTGGSTDTNIAAATPNRGWLGTPGGTYDTGSTANLTGHTITPPSGTPAVWTGQQTYAAQYSGLTLIRHGVTIDWTVDTDTPFKDYVLMCDQMLVGGGLLDAISNPTGSYLWYGFSGITGYIRFPQEFGPWTNGSYGRRVANSMRITMRRSLAPAFAYDAWSGSPAAAGINDAGTYATFMNGVPGCPWISMTAFKDCTGTTAHYLYNWNNNPLFMHGCPVQSGIGIIPIIGTPSPVTDNVAYICSVKSAVATHGLTSLNCWSFDPSTNTWTSRTFAPVAASTGGRYIFDPVANLASGDVPSGYVLDPSGGIFTVDATTPFDSSNPDTLFGFASGTI